MSQADGVSDTAPACQLCGGKTPQRNSGLCQHSCLTEGCSLALALMLDNAVSPCMSLRPFRLLLSTGVSLSAFMQGPFKTNCLGLQQLLCPLLPQRPLIFTTRTYGTSLPDTGPWSGGPGVGLGPHALGGDLHS